MSATELAALSPEDVAERAEAGPVLVLSEPGAADPYAEVLISPNHAGRVAARLREHLTDELQGELNDLASRTLWELAIIDAHLVAAAEAITANAQQRLLNRIKRLATDATAGRPAPVPPVGGARPDQGEAPNE
ncbi:hypothetical protein [Aeromicrobium marinum]|uniref:hypothetical protein n=1 Tax=Aeromicrobium marinum TaxID=219314 RepID=UPI0012EAFDB5|nr:hypothetical protein [Aeromicrobium marinum]